MISYLPDAAAVDRALVAMARALRPGGVLAIDICDLAYGRVRAAEDNGAGSARTGPSSPSSRLRPPDMFVRDITTFVLDGSGAAGAAASATRTCWWTRP